MHINSQPMYSYWYVQALTPRHTYTCIQKLPLPSTKLYTYFDGCWCMQMLSSCITVSIRRCRSTHILSEAQRCKNSCPGWLAQAHKCYKSRIIICLEWASQHTNRVLRSAGCKFPCTLIITKSAGQFIYGSYILFLFLGYDKIINSHGVPAVLFVCLFLYLFFKRICVQRKGVSAAVFVSLFLYLFVKIRLRAKKQGAGRFIFLFIPVLIVKTRLCAEKL